MWCVAELDEEYIARMEDVLAVYEKPLSAREPVVCIDEKPVVLHQEVRSPVAMRPGRVARRDAEYRRCGTANVFCGVQPKAGRHFSKVTNDRSSPEFADYLLEVAARYPEADTIHLVMDNLSSHTRKAVVERFGAEAGDWLWNRFTVHYTPKHGSWLNQAEIEISLLSRQCLGRRRIGDRPSLRKETRAWNRRMNRDRVTIQWSFTRTQARKKFGYKTWQGLSPHARLQVEFPVAQQLDEVVLECDPAWTARVQVEILLDSGRWVALTDTPETVKFEGPPGIRRAATRELKALGLRYLLVNDGDAVYPDMKKYPTFWGITQLAEANGTHFYRID